MSKFLSLYAIAVCSVSLFCQIFFSGTKLFQVTTCKGWKIRTDPILSAPVQRNHSCVHVPDLQICRARDARVISSSWFDADRHESGEWTHTCDRSEPSAGTRTSPGRSGHLRCSRLARIVRLVRTHVCVRDSVSHVQYHTYACRPSGPSAEG
jgi:hypothetical protein